MKKQIFNSFLYFSTLIILSCFLILNVKAEEIETIDNGLQTIIINNNENIEQNFSSSTESFLTNTTSTTFTTSTTIETLSPTTTIFTTTSTENNENPEQNISTSTLTFSTSTTTASNTSDQTSSSNTSTPTSSSNESIPTNTSSTTFSTSTTSTRVVEKILNYAKTQINDQGMIIDGSTTDWMIMSFSANNQSADEIKNNGKTLLEYALNYDFSDPSELNLCAGYPRHILALLSAGIEKNNPKMIESIEKTKNCLTEHYGQDGINDDIFGLLALLAVDSETNVNPIIDDIIKNQNNEGAFTWSGFASPDITGIAMNALSYAKEKNIEINQEIFTKAKNYLKSQQLLDGGFGFGVSDPSTVSWAIMGIISIGEEKNEWVNSNNKNPWNALVDTLNSDGYYESSWMPGTVDWFGTKYAVPAILSKKWPIITEPKTITPQHIAEQNNNNGGSSSQKMEETKINSTSTIPIINTSTLESKIDLTTTTVTTTLKNEKIERIDATEDKETEKNEEKPVVVYKKIIPQETKQILGEKIIQNEEKNDEQTIENKIENETEIKEISKPKIAKKIFIFSSASGGIMLLFLAWRLIKTLL